MLYPAWSTAKDFKPFSLYVFKKVSNDAATPFCHSCDPAGFSGVGPGTLDITTLPPMLLSEGCINVFTVGKTNAWKSSTLPIGCGIWLSLLAGILKGSPSAVSPWNTRILFSSIPKLPLLSNIAWKYISWSLGIAPLKVPWAKPSA